MLIVTLLASGCTSSIKLTEEESGQIVEYLSHIILKNSRYYNDNLASADVTPTVTVTPVSPEATVTPETSKDKITPTQKPQANSSFSDIIGVKGLAVEYQDYKMVNEIYDKVFPVTAPKGQKILIINFDIKNSTEKEIKLDLIDSKIDYSLQIEGKRPIKSMLTYTENILQYTEFTIPKNNSVKGVLLFLVDSSMKEVDGVLNIVKGDKIAEIELK